jgi:hypothetical protein
MSAQKDSDVQPTPSTPSTLSTSSTPRVSDPTTLGSLDLVYVPLVRKRVMSATGHIEVQKDSAPTHL